MPMFQVAVLENALRTTFPTILLLAGTTKRAEAAMLAGIESLSWELDLEKQLLQSGILAALKANEADSWELEQESDLRDDLLPRELTPVLRLPTNLRRCFVLRILLGMSRQDSAKLLQTQTRRIGPLVCLAASMLAQFAQQENESATSARLAAPA